HLFLAMPFPLIASITTLNQEPIVSIRIGASQWTIPTVRVLIPRLRIYRLGISNVIRTCESPLSVCVVSCAEVIESGFVVPFFLGEFLPHAVGVVAKLRCAHALRRQLLTVW